MATTRASDHFSVCDELEKKSRVIVKLHNSAQELLSPYLFARAIIS